MKSPLSPTLTIIVLFLAVFPYVRAQTSPGRKMMGASTKAVLTINSFAKGGDGGGPSECDGRFHSDDTLIVALSTRWYDNGRRCMENIIIHGNGNSVVAKVVDECDSNRGCRDNIVDGSRAVWKALGVPQSDWGLLHVTWSDA